jgi:hypothetical protein
LWRKACRSSAPPLHSIAPPKPSAIKQEKSGRRSPNAGLPQKIHGCALEPLATILAESLRSVNKSAVHRVTDAKKRELFKKLAVDLGAKAKDIEATIAALST